MSTAGRSQRTGRWSRAAPWLVLSAVLSGGACAQILGLEEWKPQGSTGSGGTGGATSSTSSTSSSSSASGGGGASSSASMSSSASGTDGGCVCPANTECTTYSCMNNQCVPMYTGAGSPLSMQNAGDCKTWVCDGNGGVMTQQDPNDHPPTDACNTGTCVNGMPVSTPASPGTSCGMKKTCNGSGFCEQCSGVIPSCNDFCADMGESDTDCGEACIGVGKLCGAGKHCFNKNDCAIGNCTNNSCAP